MGNSSSSSSSDSRPLREKEIERDYEKQKKKIQAIKHANVNELKDALTEVNSKNRELSESKWQVERLNAQIDGINQLNVQLNQQISNTIQKYNSAVLVFSGIVCVVVLLFLGLLMQRHDSPPSIMNNDALYTTVTHHTPMHGGQSDAIYEPVPQQYSSEGSSSESSEGHSNRVLLVSSSSLFTALRQHHSQWCSSLPSSDSSCSSTTDPDTDIDIDTSTAFSDEGFEILWRALGENHVSVSYSSLLSLVTRVFAPSLSLGLVATCVGVLFAGLAASFSVLFFWQEWDGPTQLLTSLLFMIGFTSSGVYIHQTARDPALQIPGGSLVALGCCAVYLVVLALFKTAHATTAEGKAERRHREYREDPMFRFVAVLAVGVVASVCLHVIPFAPLGVVIVSAGGWFVIFTVSLLLDGTGKSNDVTVSITLATGGGVLGYSLFLWILFNPHAGLISVYSLFPQEVNVLYPLVTDVALWIEWSVCLWGFAAVFGMTCVCLSSDRTVESVVSISGAVYAFSLGSIFIGMRVKSLAVSVVGHLGVLLFHCISVSAPMPLLALAHSGLVLASGVWQAQAQALVGPLETLSSVVLGPLGVCILTLYASSVTTDKGGDSSMRLPLQALVLNLALLAWGTYMSRTLMFLTGLVGIAVFIIHLGLTFMKGSASFVLLLVMLSFVVATLGILSQ